MRIGSYEVLSKVGATAMSTVFRARADDGRMVAMKVLRSIVPSARERFERELRLMQALGEEAGFVPCLEVIESKQGSVLVMPFIPGGTLRTKLAAGPLDVEEVVALGRTLAAALARAHEKGIVHRDVKPENVLFTAEGRPLLGDLGIAKHFREDTPGASQSYELTRSNTFLGTVCYMPAEQIQNAKNAGPPADVFALAAVLYECLTGEPAYLAPNAIETLRRVLKEDLDPLSKRAPKTPPWLAQAIERALARDPRKRYPDAAAFAKALAPPRRSAPIVPLLLGGAALVAVGGPLALWIAIRSPPPPPPPPPVKPEVAVVASSAPPTPRVPVYEPPGFAKGFARSTKVKLTRVFGDTSLHYHGTVGYLAVAPDDRKVLTANERGELVVWDLEKGEETVQPPCPLGQWALAWGASGPRALDLDWRELRLWTPEDPDLRVLDSAKDGYFTGTLTADGERALVATPSGRVDVIQLATARHTQTLVSSMDEAVGPLRPLALDWKHQRAYAGASHGKIHVFDLTRERESGLIEGHDDAVLVAAATADGTKLLTGSVDDSVRLWDLETKKELWRTAADNYPLHTLELSKDGESFIFVANECLELHETKTGERRVTFEAPRVLCGGFTHDGRRVVAGTEDGFLYVFEAATGKRLQKLGSAFTGIVEALKESPDGRVFCSQARALVTRDAKTGDELARAQAPPSGGFFTPDGRAVGFDPATHVVRVLGPEGKLMFEEPAEKFDAPWIALSPDGRRVVLVEADKIAALELSTRRWTGPWSTRAGPDSEVKVVVSNTGRALTYQRGREAPTFLWDIEKGVKVARLDEHRLVSQAALAPDATLALLAGPDGPVSLWDLRGEKPTLVDRLDGHKLDVTAIAFLGTKRAVTASLDRTLRVWDLATRTVFERLELGPVPGPVNVLEATSDGRSFLVGTENQTILRFEIPD